MRDEFEHALEGGIKFEVKFNVYIVNNLKLILGLDCDILVTFRFLLKNIKKNELISPVTVHVI